MIKGAVNSSLEAVIELTVRGPSGAVIDTGFSDWSTPDNSYLCFLRRRIKFEL